MVGIVTGKLGRVQVLTCHNGLSVGSSIAMFTAYINIYWYKNIYNVTNNTTRTGAV